MTIVALRHDKLTEAQLEILLACRAEYAIHASSVSTRLLWILLDRGYLKWEKGPSWGWVVLTPKGKMVTEQKS